MAKMAAANQRNLICILILSQTFNSLFLINCEVLKMEMMWLF